MKERRKALDLLPIPLSGTAKPLQYMKDCMQLHLDNGNINEAFQVPKQVSHADVVDQIKRLRTHPDRSINRSDEIDAFTNVAQIQDSLLKADKDKYLIHKWGSRSMGNKHSFIFKTSEMSLQMAALMAGKIKIGGENSLLAKEPAYFDGMHGRTKFFVSLTMWVFHPGMRAMVILAIMDTLKEDSDHIELFFDIFTKAVAHYINEPEYIWDPHYIMMDEKGANFEAIERVFGADFRHSKTKTCQWHFMHCAERYLGKVPEIERKKFRRWCRKLCNSHTKPEYKYWAGKIHAFTIEYDFEGWWKWWAPRCPHIVPALRGFNIPKMNMAETGQSKLKKPKKVWLSTATTADICEFTFQQARYENFLKNIEKIMGRGPSHKQRTQRERAEERRYVDQVCDLILNGDILDERDDEEEYDFVPSKSAKHRPPKNLKKVPQERPNNKVKVKSPNVPNVNVTHCPKPVTLQPPSYHHNPKKLPPREGRGTNPRYAGDDNVRQE